MSFEHQEKFLEFTFLPFTLCSDIMSKLYCENGKELVFCRCSRKTFATFMRADRSLLLHFYGRSCSNQQRAVAAKILIGTRSMLLLIPEGEIR